MAILNRHRVLLSLLLEAPRIPMKTQLVKWLFLLREETCLKDDPSFYSFVPYRYGPFSFTVYRDLEYLGEEGYVASDGSSFRPEPQARAAEPFKSLPTRQQLAITDTLSRYGRLSCQNLVSSVYERYPWYASRSAISPHRAPTPPAHVAVYTAGYEGESIDLFLQKLLRAGIRRIIDVRNNPVSRKYGFSKHSLASLSSRLRLDYVHMPCLGIPPAMRRHLEDFEDYDRLFHEYENSILPQVPEAVAHAADLLAEKPSVLVCFEAAPRCCHRGRLASAIAERTDLEVVHL